MLAESVSIVATDLNQPMLDQARAFSEARRVLSSGGVFIFNVWDRIEENEFADTVTTALEALEALFPENPPRFMARDASRLGEATDIAASAIAQRFGPGAVVGKIQAHVVTIEN